MGSQGNQLTPPPSSTKDGIAGAGAGIAGAGCGATGAATPVSGPGEIATRRLAAVPAGNEARRPEGTRRKAPSQSGPLPLRARRTVGEPGEMVVDGSQVDRRLHRLTASELFFFKQKTAYEIVM